MYPTALTHDQGERIYFYIANKNFYLYLTIRVLLVENNTQ